MHHGICLMTYNVDSRFKVQDDVEYNQTNFDINVKTN